MSARNIVEKIKKENIEFVDFKFTDMKGKSYQISHIAEDVSEGLLQDGIMFDGSSVDGWKAINESDMILKPDFTTAYIDPFVSRKSLALTCNVVDPLTKDFYIRDPRSTASRAEKYLRETELADDAYFGPEIEFFIFDEVCYQADPYESYIKLSSLEFSNSGSGYHMESKGSYCSISPKDLFYEIRLEMMTTLKEVGIKPILHHHEVAPSQLELGFKYDSIIGSADNCLKYKYIVRKVAEKYGKTVTFMPKPIPYDNGSGMHVHQSLWKEGKNLFAGDGYAGLSETCLYYIGGIIKHAKAINAFTNPTTNSYKRLVQGYEAPVVLAYSSKNRSASIRIPYVSSEPARRIEVRFPDPLANPYYGFSAMLMAGIDGIINKIHPGEAMDQNLYKLTENELRTIPKLSDSLSTSLQALSEDREFLKKGNVFSDDQIDAYIRLKRSEIDQVSLVTSPIEYKLYYSM